MEEQYLLESCGSDEDSDVDEHNDIYGEDDSLLPISQDVLPSVMFNDTSETRKDSSRRKTHHPKVMNG